MMPYTFKTFPERIKALPFEAKKIWVTAFNNAYRTYKGNESISNSVAWKAVENAGYYKNKEGKWVKKKS